MPLTLSPGAVRIAAGGIPAAAMAHLASIGAAQWWGLDQSWASKASQVDGWQCVDGTQKPYVRGTCGGSPVCNWTYLSVDQECNPNTFAKTMFQTARYTWAQEQVARLMVSKPRLARDKSVPGAAVAWADWCIQVMRLISLARWSTNIREEYLVPLHEGAEAKRLYESIKGYLPVQPSKADPRDQIETNDAFTMLHAVPKTWAPIPTERPLGAGALVRFRVPTQMADYDPKWITTGFLLTRGERPWPFEKTSGRYPGAGQMRNALIKWFEVSLSATTGSGSWVAGHNVRAAVTGFVGCPFGPSPVCTRQLVNRRHWWGAANVQIRMCEAWAQDLLNTSVGDAIQNGTDRFLERFRTLPPSVQLIGAHDIGLLKDQITAANINKINADVSVGFGAAGMLVQVIPVIGQVIGAVIAVAGALVTLLLEILNSVGGIAAGAADIERQCLPPLTIRSISVSGARECTLEPPDGSGGGGGGSSVNPLVLAGFVGAAGLLGYLALRTKE